MLLNLEKPLATWTIPIVIMIVFSLLWSKVSYVLISSLLLWVVTIPMWLFFIEKTKEGQGYTIFVSSIPFVVLAYIAFVLLPEVIIVVINNYIIRKVTNHTDDE